MSNSQSQYAGRPGSHYASKAAPVKHGPSKPRKKATQVKVTPDNTSSYYATNVAKVAITGKARKKSTPSRQTPEDEAKHKRAAQHSDIEQQCWYHGLCSRPDTEALLVKSGDFIVRASERGGAVSIILSFYAGLCKHHLTIGVSPAGLFYLVALRKDRWRYFSTVVDLIKYYKLHTIKLKDAEGNLIHYQLKEGVPRPKWLINSEMISFDPTKKPLGTGNFANVFIGTFIPSGQSKHSAIPVAIKVLKEKSGSADEREAKQAMIREGKVMSFYSHPNVVQFYGLACDRPQQVILVMEFCTGGSLESHLKAQGKKIETAELLTFAFEAALGMRYLHRQGCLHRDLAARNCLISDHGVIKIGDFGLSSADGLTEQPITNMPLRWLAPEAISKKPLFSTKSDVWAFGVLVFEIFNEGEKPWPDDDVKPVAKRIRQLKMPPMPAITPKPVKELVASIWVKEPHRRPSFSSISVELARIRAASLKTIDPSKISVNRIPGVHRVDFAVDEETLDMETPTTRHDESATDKFTDVITDQKTIRSAVSPEKSTSSPPSHSHSSAKSLKSGSPPSHSSRSSSRSL